jgi:hypothetical protein
MDINESLQPVVAGLINSLKGNLETELRAQISDEVVKKIAASEFTDLVTKLVEQQTKQRLEQFNIVGKSDEELQKIVRQITDQINTTLTAEANNKINTFLNQKLAQIDVNAAIAGLVQSKLSSLLQTQAFPAGSISHASINFDGVKLTGDYISGGIITNFGSTGIEDRASFVQLTLMDHASAFEGPVFAPALKVTGDVRVEGKLVLAGSIDTTTPVFKTIVDSTTAAVKLELNTDLFSGFSDTIFDKIRTEGLDLDKITQGGRDIVKGGQLGYHIIDTNIRKLGVVADLETTGDTLLSDTLYAVNGRVGINTKEPATALSIWDQEVEVTVNKYAQDTAFVGTPRRHHLVLGANGKEAIKIDVDGLVHVDRLSLGGVLMTSASAIPNYPGIGGQLVWNSAPGHGSAIGWVCLGGTLWAKFGIVE